VLHRSRAFETLEAWIVTLRARWQPPTEPDPTDSQQRNVANYQAAGGNLIGAVMLANDAGIPIVLLGQCTRKVPAQVIASVAKNSGVPHLDATGMLDATVPALLGDPRFADWRAQQRERYGDELDAHPNWLAFLPDTCHPNAIGHRLVADELAEILASALPAPKP